MYYVPLSEIQAAFVSSTATYRAFIGGRGSGKSWVACYDLILRATRRPNRTYLLASPTYPMLFDSELRAFVALARQLGVLRDLKQSAPASARLHNGAEILFRSADDPERLRGPNISGCVLMEAALMHKDAYDIAIACLREGGEQGWLSAATTPRGPNHWTYDVFASDRPDTELFRASTGENPFLPDGFEEQLKEQYGDTNWARQELGGEFVAIEGAEFDASWLAGDDLWFDAWPTSAELKVIALDPSKGTDGRGRDYQAHVLIQAVIEGGRYVYYVDADLRREGVVPMTERTVQLYRQFSASGRTVDSVIVEDNATMGLLPQAFDAATAKLRTPLPYLCRTSTDPKEWRIRFYLGPLLSRRQIRFRRTPGARMLLGELSAFPFGEFDDASDALAAGVRRADEMLRGKR